MADNEPWAPSDKDEYIEALHQAQLKTELHKWEQAIGLKAHSDEEAAKNPPKDESPKDEKTKRRSFL